MGKKALAFLLAGALFLTGIGAEQALAAPTENTETEEAFDDSVTPDQGACPDGGFQAPKAIEISEEMAESIELIEEEDVEIKNGRMILHSESYGSQKYDSSWDIYSSNYIYNRLSANERKFWDLLDALCRRYLVTTVNASAQTLQGNTYYIADKWISYSSLGLSEWQLSILYTMFTYSNPQYYFLENGYLFGQGSMCPIIYAKFARGVDRISETEKVKRQIDAMKSKVEKGTDDLDKARIAHDLIVEKIQYDRGYDTGNYYTPYHQSAYSVFQDDYTVCAGYTKSFSILMNSVGIDTIGVTSLIEKTDIFGEKTTTGHAWNMICLNDSWYYVDLTWDDQDGAGGRSKIYTYFGISKTTLTRKLDTTGFHQEEPGYTGLIPVCTKDLGSTELQVGTAYLPTATTAAVTIKQNKTKSGMSVTLKTATPGADNYYTIDGKTPSSSYTRSYHYTGPFKVTANVTVKAVAVKDGQWNSKVSNGKVNGKMYTVTFNTMGGKKLSSKLVWPGEAVEKPANPKRAKYQFAGWYKEKGCKSKWNFKSKITKNTTVYAKWNKVKVAKTSVSLKNQSGRKLKVTVKKISGAKGYEIRYSLNSNMSSAKKKEAKSGVKTISGLKKGARYYVQARAWKLDSAGKKVYGDWGSAKAVTIRK